MANRLITITVLIALLLALVPVSAFAAPPSQEGGMVESVPCAEDYTVQLADWLSNLADRFLGDPLAYPAIVLATNLAAVSDSSYAVIVDPDTIEPGQKLCVPSQEDANKLLALRFNIHMETKDIGPNNPFWQTVWDGAEAMANK